MAIRELMTGFPRDPATGRAPADLMKRGGDGFVRVAAAEDPNEEP